MGRQHVLLSTEPTGRPVDDGRALLAALGRGRSYCAFDGLADARGARFTVTSGAVRGTLGDSLPWAPGARLEVELPETARQGPRTEVRVIRNGEVLASRGADDGRAVPLPGPGIYRVEVMMRRGGTRLPWILTNPVWVTRGSEGPP